MSDEGGLRIEGIDSNFEFSGTEFTLKRDRIKSNNESQFSNLDDPIESLSKEAMDGFVSNSDRFCLKFNCFPNPNFKGLRSSCCKINEDSEGDWLLLSESFLELDGWCEFSSTNFLVKFSFFCNPNLKVPSGGFVFMSNDDNDGDSLFVLKLIESYLPELN